MVPPEGNTHQNHLPRLAMVAFALLALGILLSIVVPRFQREERTLVCPIEVTGTPEGYMLALPSHAQAKIRISGRPADFNRTDRFRLQVNLPDNPPLEGAYPIVPNLSPSCPLKILEITPREIPVRLAQTVQREFPVEVRLVGKPAPGFQLGNVTISPDLTLVSGPREAIEALKAIRTTPISVADASAGMKLEVPAESPGEALLTLAPELFTVLVQVEEIQSTTLLKEVPITTGGNDPRTISVTPETVDIEVSGPARLVEALKAAGGVTAVIDTRGLETGVFVRRAAITLPEGVSFIGAYPELFTVNIPPKS